MVSSSGHSDEEIHLPEHLTYVSFSVRRQFQHVLAYNALAHSFIELVEGAILNALSSSIFIYVARLRLVYNV